MHSFKAMMAQQTLLPIIQADTAEEGVAIAKAMADADIHVVEVVLRTPASIDALIAIKKALPEMKVGAGTITSPQTLKQALDAKADFIVTPAISESLIKHLSGLTIPVLPGISTTSDLLLATEHGYTEVKLFPASLSGGPSFIQAMSSLFPQVSFCPTGGVKQQNKEDYLSLSNCFAVGGTWISPKVWVEQKQWHNITEACKLANS